MYEFFTSIDNRELAIIIWLAVIILILSMYSKLRSSMFNVIKATFVKPFILGFSILASYYFLIVLLLQWIGLWTTSQMKLTVFWFITVGLVGMFSATSIRKQPSYFKKSVRSNFKLTILFDFFINLYKMTLIAELVFLPIMTILFMLQAVSETDKELESARKLFSTLIIVISSILLLFLIYQTIINIQSYANFNSLLDIILPIIFSLFLLPFLWVLVIYIAYEEVLIRLKFIVPDSTLHPYIKRSLLINFKGRTDLLDAWFKTAWYNDFKAKKDIDKSIHSLFKGKSDLNL